MEQAQKIKFGDIISAAVKVSNEPDEDRTYDIQATARVSGGALEAVEGGTVSKDGQQLADFGSYTPGQLSINFQPSGESMDAVYDAVGQFMDQVKASAEANASTLGITKEGGQA